MAAYNKNEIKSIRILPMSGNDPYFNNCSIEEMQQTYFFRVLPVENQGCYSYKTNSLPDDCYTLVLFQYDNHIIASAVLSSKEKYDDEDDDEYDGEGYTGEYQFDISSIAVFGQISYAELHQVFPEVTRLSNVLWKLDVDKFDDLLELLKTKSITFFAENENYYEYETEMALDTNLEGFNDDAKAKNNRTISVPERSMVVKKIAIEKSNFKCEIDPNHELFKARNEYDYVEAHHLIPLSQQSYHEKNLDVPENVVALCPNCHKKLHHGRFDLVKDDLSRLYHHRITGLNKKGIIIELDELLEIYDI